MGNAGTAIARQPEQPQESVALRWSGLGVVATSWVSAASFGMYILAFYLGAIPTGHLEQWNQNLEGLYDKKSLLALLSMSAHFVTGAVLLLLGPVQLIAAVRKPLARAASLAGTDLRVFRRRRRAGRVGFYRNERDHWRRRDDGRLRALRGAHGAGRGPNVSLCAQPSTGRAPGPGRSGFFALTIGSWLYRMDYGFWLLAAHRLGSYRELSRPVRYRDVLLLLTCRTWRWRNSSCAPRASHPIRHSARPPW